MSLGPASPPSAPPPAPLGSGSGSGSASSAGQRGCTFGSSPSVPPRPRRSWSRRSNSWTPEEDKRLVELVDQETAVPPSMSAFKTWSRVAAQLTNRTGKQCRERYLNQLKPGIRRDPWTADEERVLHEAHAKYGNKWVTIAAQLPGRTDNCVKNHWNSMLRKRQRREAALRAAQKDITDRLGQQANGGYSSGSGTGMMVSSGGVIGGSNTAGAGGVSGASIGEEAHVVTTPTTPTSSGMLSTGHGDRSASDMELSYRTGCATPSGLSSTYDMQMSSDVGSPYTACSPTTPKRDAKLQISSLVTSQEKDVNGGVPLFSTTQWRSVTNETRGGGELGTPGGAQAPVVDATQSGASASGRDSGSGSADLSGADSSCVVTMTSMGSAVGRSWTLGASDVAAVDHVSNGRCSRRSRRLQVEAAEGEQRHGTSRNEAGNAKVDEWDDTGEAMKVRRVSCNSGNVGNALAALAMAASSVPPSPLTPESRFSGCGRSRSASPVRRGCDEQRAETSAER